MFKPKLPPIPKAELTRSEIEELIRTNMAYARKWAEEGNVSGMEMALEEVIQRLREIQQPINSREMAQLKAMGYERGTKLMCQRAEQLEKAGKIREAQNSRTLAESYKNEAELIKRSL
jgi:soluble cytochrome b562